MPFGKRESVDSKELSPDSNQLLQVPFTPAIDPIIEDGDDRDKKVEVINCCENNNQLFS